MPVAAARPRARRGGATDLGCGAGTLGIAAARLGWGPITAIDLAPEAVELTARNAETNGVEIDASQADLRTAPFPPRELLLVNAPPPVQERVAAAITPDVRHVIVSGIVEGELPEVLGQVRGGGIRPEARSGRGHVGRGPDGAPR